MLSERLQLLLSPEQKRRLEHEAATTGRSIGALVREAIDAVYDVTPASRRRAALDEILAMGPVAVPGPEELRELIDASHDDEILDR